MTRLKISSAATYLGVSISTLKRWDADGQLVAHRYPNGRRYYNSEELDLLLEDRQVVAYYRYFDSTSDKANIKAIKDYVKEISDDSYEVILDKGYRLDVNRKGLQKLFTRLGNNELKTIVIWNAENVYSYGIEFLEHACHKKEIELIQIANSQSSGIDEGDRIVEDVEYILENNSIPFEELTEKYQKLQK